MSDAKISVKPGQIKSIVRRLNRFGKNISSRNVLNVIALGIKNRILVRTHSGLDKNFKRFYPYNAAYAEKEGKTLVNLTQRGHMLNSMTQKVLNNNVAKIFFSTKQQREKALWHVTGAGNLPVRDFFGVNRKDEKFALKAYQKNLSKVKRSLKL